MTSAEWLATGSAIAIACMAFLMALRTKGANPANGSASCYQSFLKSPTAGSAPLDAVENRQ